EGATGLDIRGRVYSADGTAAGDDFLVNTTTESEQFLSQVTALSGGGFMVTWDSIESPEDGATDIRGRVFGADGTAAGDDFLVNTTTESVQFGSVITALGDGGFVVTWNSFESPDGTTDVRGRIFGADGTPAGDDFLVNTTTESSQGLPQTAVLSDG